MAHFAVSDLASGRFHVFDRLQREGAGWAGAATDRYAVWNGTWSARANADGSHHVEARDKTARAAGSDDGTRVALDLTLTNTTRWMTHGRDGYSRKGREVGNASAYYSLPRLETRGTIEIDGRRYEVTGASWMDHEFGSSVLEADQVGWDWFGLQLEDGRDLMLYQMRRRDGSRDPFSSGTLIGRDGTIVRLTRDDYELEPLETWRSEATGTTLSHTLARHDSQPTPRRSRSARRCPIRSCIRRGRPMSRIGRAPSTSLAALRGRGYAELTGYNGVALSDAFK